MAQRPRQGTQPPLGASSAQRPAQRSWRCPSIPSPSRTWGSRGPILPTELCAASWPQMPAASGEPWCTASQSLLAPTLGLVGASVLTGCALSCPVLQRPLLGCSHAALSYPRCAILPCSVPCRAVNPLYCSLWPVTSCLPSVACWLLVVDCCLRHVGLVWRSCVLSSALRLFRRALQLLRPTASSSPPAAPSGEASPP